MVIYIAHSNSYDYKGLLYAPIRNSKLNEQHEFVLPHEKSEEPYNSKEFLKRCDLLLAEVSFPSTGLGMELGWASAYGVPIFDTIKLCL